MHAAYTVSPVILQGWYWLSANPLFLLCNAAVNCIGFVVYLFSFVIQGYPNNHKKSVSKLSSTHCCFEASLVICN
jgi:hypothetical protein